MVISINNKQCTRCKEFLPLEDFYMSTRGYTSKCKPCTVIYNTENRKKNGPRRPKKKTLQTEVHRKLLEKRGPGNSMFHGRYIHGYSSFSLYLGPWGWLCDGELHYGPYTHDDVIYTLAKKHMKLIENRGSDLDLESVLEACSLVRNSCGVPIEVRFVRGLVSRPQYFLWMDEPRNLLKSEVSHQLNLDPEIIDFLFTENETPNIKSPIPGNIKNPSTNNPQVIENTYDYVEDSNDA